MRLFGIILLHSAFPSNWSLLACIPKDVNVGKGRSIKGPSFVVDVYKNPFGLKSCAYAYAAPENRHSNCKGAIVFLRRGNNCVYKWTVEMWDLKAAWGQIENDKCRSEFVEGRISLELGKTDTVKICSPTMTERVDFSRVLSLCSESDFSPLQTFVLPVFRNTCWFVYCSQIREKSRGGEGIGFT